MLRKAGHLAPINFLSKSSLLFFVFSLCFVFWLFDLWRPYNANKNGSNFVWDMFGYYSYLPATFLNHGSFDFDETVWNFNGKSPFGEYMPKYTYGVALMQLPFFLLAWLVSAIEGNVGSGFSKHYCEFQEYGAIFYVLLGLWLMRKLLLAYFSETAVTLTLFVSLFGTMLFNYTFVQSEMSHSYLFTLLCVFMYGCERYYKHGSKGSIALIAISGAIITLIRPTELFVFVFYFTWGITSPSEIIERLRKTLTSVTTLLWLAVPMLLVWLPQMLFWKSFTGHYFFDSYVDEFFFWSDPQFFNVLLSYRKGWLVYTPLVSLAFIGLFFMKKQVPIKAWVVLLVLVVMTYIYSCWWDWDYGGCFGAREFCQHMAYLMWPFCALFDRFFNVRYEFVLRRLFTIVILACVFIGCFLNIGQTYQYQIQRKISPSQMSEKLYWQLFTTYQYNKYFEEVEYWQMLNKDSSQDWRKGLHRNDQPNE